MPASPRRLHLFPSIAGRNPQDPVLRLGRLWKAFEKTGAVSAYIAYRTHFAHLARENQAEGFWARRDQQ